MSDTLYRDPQLDRILADQATRGWENARNERLACEAFSAAGYYRRTRPRDRAAEQRCAETFGLTGGELCGCHTGGCDTCDSNGGCGDAGCRTCIGYGYQAPARRQGVGTQVKEPRTSRAVPPPDDEELVDVHSHNICSTQDDVDTALDAGTHDDTGTETDERIDMLYGVKGVEGTSEMWVSGLVDKAIPVGKVSDTDTVNLVTARAVTRHPDFIIPVLQVLQDDLMDTASGATVGLWLDFGFKVVGELIIHGHLSSNFDLPALTAICQAAVERGKSVMVHWDIGRVDANTSATDNWNDLMDLLSAFPRWSVETYEAWVEAIDKAVEEKGSECGDDLAEAMEVCKADMRPLRLILAHCGAGPNAVPFDEEDPEFDEYKGRINTLIKDWPSVYFDLAGMQIEADDPESSVHQLYTTDPTTLTPLGAFLLEKMEGRPDRFMLGNDIENRTPKDYPWEDQILFGVDTYAASIQNYLDFLDMGSLTAEQKVMIKSTNAKAVRTAYV